MESKLLDAILAGWRWKMGTPVEVVAANQFGNVLVRNEAGSFFRIIPEEWQCNLVAASRAELKKKRKDPEFIRDWEMSALVCRAEKAYGPLARGQVYCLVIPGLLGGAYSEENIRKINLTELLSYSGDMARQVENLPDGADVKLMIKK